MLRQSVAQQQAPFSSLEYIQDNVSIDRSLLLDIVHENHLLYHMEQRDRPNNIVRVLVNLHKFKATKEQLAIAYGKTKLDVASLHVTDSSNKINEENWLEFLGTSCSYGDYLVFFDKQMSALGLEETLDRYFYSLEPSIGSQMQPLVQLSFGIEHNLPEIITQALAYYASSYLDVSAILEYCQPYSGENQANNIQFVNGIMFDLIHADQRFDGKIEGDNTFQSAVKLLLKSKSDLIKTYMAVWSGYSQSPQQKLDALLCTATTLAKVASKRNATHVELDWFLAGGQLIDSALAIQKVIRSDQLENWVNVQFLSTLCTFVVQGRPMHVVSTPLTTNDWESCTSIIVKNAFDNPKLILALDSVMNARCQHPQLEPLCLEVANTLALFSSDGTWVKSGLGWSN
ncbi:Sister chromatid cohesion protein 2 [Mucor velutinosus]|uniref:Sister chromatid cohesion protein 2 n=1 Tax=Mucor velutinosus TaxID=708070 RepID=A0AAN7D7C0_9FUNG|nr:Sister chromatid cohesion protein 2 [Mucor velutinosus]